MLGTMATTDIGAFLAALERGSGGRLGVMACELNSGRELISGREFAHHPDLQVPTASVYKLFVLLHVACAAQEGTLDWNALLPLKPEHQSPGSGVLKDLTPGLTLPLHDACRLMIAVSDNAATNMVLDHVGIEAVSARLRSFGLTQTALVAQQRTPRAPRLPYATGHTTPQETANLLIGLVQNTLAAPAVCQQVLAILSTQQDHSMIGRFLPPGWQYAGKTVADADLRADVGLVTAPDHRRFVLALFCHGLPPQLGWGVDHPGVLALARLANRLLYQENAETGA
jgi:beta-lactamase class A